MKKHKHKKITPKLESIPSKKKWINQNWLLPAGIFIFTFLVFSNTLNYEFTNWDDDHYVTKNPDITGLNWINIKKIFTGYYFANYQPLTMLTYLIDYSIGQFNPFGYHFVNILFHSLNSVIVFILIKKISTNIQISALTAFLFGIHPFHVESVAWISGRKDVVFTFFYLFSLLYYLKYYMKDFKMKFYFFSVVFFILSCLSKSMAMSLPFVLLLIDYLYKRKISKKMIIEKLPYLLITIITALAALGSQQEAGAFKNVGDFTFMERIIFACYSLMKYFYKLLIPSNLSAFYPYPGTTGNISLIYYSGILFVLLLITFLVFAIIRNKRNIVFNFSFFLITIAPVLQIIAIGGAMMADRYSYLSSIGFFFPVSTGIYYLMYDKKVFRGIKLKLPLLVLVVTYLILLSYNTFERNKIWKDSFSLWKSVIEIYPEFPDAWNNRGDEYYGLKKFDLAIADFNQAIKCKPDFVMAYDNRGNAWYEMNMYDNAIIDFTLALKYDSTYAMGFYNRALAYAKSGKHDSAVFDLNKAIRLEPQKANFYNNRGDAFFQLGENEKAIEDFNIAIQLKPDIDLAFYNRGCAYYKKGDIDLARKDFETAVTLNPNYSNAFNNLGVIALNGGNNTEAIRYFSKVITLVPDNSSGYSNLAVLYHKTGDWQNAVVNYERAVQLNPADKNTLNNLIQLLTERGDTGKAGMYRRGMGK